MIVAFSIAGLLGARHISLPTLTFTYQEGFRGRTETAEYTVDGMHCYGTANLLTKHISEVPGLVSIIAYGGRHRAVIEYDPQKTTPGDIHRAIEAPVETPKGPMQWFKVTATK